MGAKQKNFGKKKETAKVKRAKRREKKLRALKRAGIVPTKPFSSSSSSSVLLVSSSSPSAGRVGTTTTTMMMEEEEEEKKKKKT